MPGFEAIGNEELNETVDVFNKGGVLFRHGFDSQRKCYKVSEFETLFAKKMQSKYALAVSSGTAALRVALAGLGIGKGDEVITQSFTFVATVEAIIESRATPVCCDINKTINLDPDELLNKITSKTKAVIAVHMLGYPANLKKIKEICSEKGIFLIEDTAWGCGGNINGIPLGNWGDIGTFSFDFAKTITTGEGGMLIFKSKDVFETAKAWHDHGHENNPLVPRWEDTRKSSGFNYRMMELQGAIGIAQLKKLEMIVKSQRNNYQLLWEGIKDIQGIDPIISPDKSYGTCDALIFFVPSKELALNCRNELLAENLGTKILPEAYTWHFCGTWDHMDELLKANKYNLFDSFKKSHDILSRAVSIPISIKDMSISKDKLIKALTKALT